MWKKLANFQLCNQFWKGQQILAFTNNKEKAFFCIGCQTNPVQKMHNIFLAKKCQSKKSRSIFSHSLYRLKKYTTKRPSSLLSHGLIILATKNAKYTKHNFIMYGKNAFFGTLSRRLQVFSLESLYQQPRRPIGVTLGVLHDEGHAVGSKMPS